MKNTIVPKYSKSIIKNVNFATIIRRAAARHVQGVPIHGAALPKGRPNNL